MTVFIVLIGEPGTENLGLTGAPQGDGHRPGRLPAPSLRAGTLLSWSFGEGQQELPPQGDGFAARLQLRTRVRPPVLGPTTLTGAVEPLGSGWLGKLMRVTCPRTPTPAWRAQPSLRGGTLTPPFTDGATDSLPGVTPRTRGGRSLPLLPALGDGQDVPFSHSNGTILGHPASVGPCAWCLLWSPCT